MLFPLKALLVYVRGWSDNYRILVWLICRLASVLLGTATVYLQFRFARSYLSPRAAFLSAVLLATAFYPVLNSAVATLDVPLSFLLLANLLFLKRLQLQSNSWNAILLGVATAYLIGTKLSGIPFLVVPLGLVMFRRISLRALLLYGVVALGVFLAFHPHMLLNPAKYVRTFRAEQFNWNERTAGSLGETVATWADATGVALGIPLAVMAAAGILVWRPHSYRLEITLLAGATLASYLLWPGFFPPRFVIAFAPCFCLFAAGFYQRLADVGRPLVHGVGIVAAILTVTVSMYECVTGIWIRWKDPRPVASKFLLDSVPEGASLGVSVISEKFPWRYHSWIYPALDSARYAERALWEYPEYVITSATDLDQINLALKSRALRADDSWDPDRNRDWYMYSPPSPRLFAFYRRLLSVTASPYEVIRSFRIPVRVPLEFAPAEVRVYRLHRHSTGRDPGHG